MDLARCGRDGASVLRVPDSVGWGPLAAGHCVSPCSRSSGHRKPAPRQSPPPNPKPFLSGVSPALPLLTGSPSALCLCQPGFSCAVTLALGPHDTRCPQEQKEDSSGPSLAASTSAGGSLPATDGSRTFQGRSLTQWVGPAWLCVPTGAAGPLGAAPGRDLAGVRLAGGISAGLTGSWARATFPSTGTLWCLCGVAQNGAEKMEPPPRVQTGCRRPSV